MYVRLWDVASGKVIGTLNTERESCISELALSPDSRYLVGTYGGGQVVIWDCQAQAEKVRFRDRRKEGKLSL